MKPADQLRAARAIKEQYAYLNNRAAIAAADPGYLASERFVQTAMSYSEAGRGTFEDARLDEEKGIYSWEVNFLDDGVEHHCKPKRGVESCPQQSEKGAVKVGTLLLPTRRACNVRCRCRIERFKTREAAEAAIA